MDENELMEQMLRESFPTEDIPGEEINETIDQMKNFAKQEKL